MSNLAYIYILHTLGMWGLRMPSDIKYAK